MKVFRILLILPLAIMLMALHEPNFEETDSKCSSNSDMFFGISRIPLVAGWSQFCTYQAGDAFYNPTGSHVNHSFMVGTPYSFFNSNNPWSWWIEGGWVDGGFCFDNDTQSTQGGFNCIKGKTMSALCPVTIWLQVVGECDNCVNNTVGGTWYKGQLTIDPFQMGTSCGFGINMTSLSLEPRTNCTNTSYPWGCGPGEFQD